MSPPSRSWTHYLFGVRDMDIRDPNAKLVLYALASRADNDGYCYLSINRIARDTALSRRTVQRKLVALETANIVERHVRRRVDDPRHHDTTLYRLMVSPRHYPRHDDTRGNVVAGPNVESARHPNLPITNQINRGVAQTLGEENPPADADDDERRRRIAAAAGEVAEQLRSVKRRR